MAGTLSYSLKVRHVFQRKFDSESLGEALSACHWYIITRRPSVRIVPETVRLDDDIITLDIVTRSSARGEKRAHHLAADLASVGMLKNFEVHANDAYFSASVGDHLIHGDAWALASLLSLASPDISRQEVLYIGQAFGKGENNAWHRTQNHEKLQRIYEDHAGDDWDVFVAPLVLEKRSVSTDDHINDAEDGPDLAAYYENFAAYGGGILKPSVDLIEHSLISYFRPHYNERLREWRPSDPTNAMRKMRSGRFRLLHIHLNGWMGLARFYSNAEPEQIRSHFISHDIPSEPRRPTLQRISAPQLSEWSLDAKLVEGGRGIFADLAEYSGVELSIFGDKAPSVRIPSEVVLPLTVSLQGGLTKVSNDTMDHLHHSEMMRGQIKEAREALKKATEPILHPGKASYDPSTGLITTGQRIDNSEATWQLHDPEGSGVRHGLIIGNPGMGKSNSLWIIMLEAALSGVFVVVPSDPRDEHDYLNRCKPFVGDRTGLISRSVPETIENLRAACRIIDARVSKGGYNLPVREKPGILLTIDDADEVLHDSSGCALVEKVLMEGGSVCVGIVVVVRDLAGLEGDSSLLRCLASMENKQAFMHDGYYRIMDFTATYGSRRSSTMSSHAVTFVLHWGPTEMTLGRLLSIGNPELTPAEAQNWADGSLGDVKDPLTPWDTFDGDQQCWWSLDFQFFLYRHLDGWALLRWVSRTSAEETQIEALKWADSVLFARFDIERDDWVLGPATDKSELVALYANALSEPIVKPFPSDDYLRWRY